MGKTPGFDPSIPWKLYRLLKNERPDVVNTHLRAILYSFPAQIRLKIRSFHTIHNVADREVGKAYKYLLHLLLNHFGFTAVSISPAIAESTVKLYGPQHRLVIENGIEQPKTTPALITVRKQIDNLKPSSDFRVLINIGRISRQKNQKMLIDAYCDLVNSGYKTILLILGPDHELAEAVKRHAKESGCNHIYFLGMQKNPNDYLACADIFCLSSLHEGLPLTLLEAFATGTIPVCTPVGGIPDVIEPGKTGFISSDLSAMSFSSTLKQVLDMPTQRLTDIQSRMKAIYEKRYSITTCANRYIAAYQQLTDNDLT